MAKELIQVVNQYNQMGIPVRFIVQYKDTETDEQEQSIVNREDLDDADLEVFDNYENMVSKFMA